MKREGRHFGKIHYLLIIGLILFGANFSNAQVPDVWGNLKPGEYGVGFKSVELYDYSRVFQAKNDYFGNLLEGERARQMQILIWYPAEKNDNDLPMVYAEYSLVYPQNIDFIDLLTAIHNRQMGMLFGMVGNNRIFINGFIDFPFAGVRDATPISTSFPFLIYIPSLQGGTIENLVLCEYLASHGFIVATTHPVGLKQLNPAVNSVDFETLVRDAEFVFGYMNNFPNANMDKVGAFGFASGGSAALLFQIRNSDIDAVAGLASSFSSPAMIELIKGNSFYNPALAQKPLMNFYFEDMEQADMSLIDSLFYSTRYLYHYANTDPTNYSLFEILRKISGENPTGTDILPYEVVSDYVLNFYRAILNKDESSLSFIKKSADQNGYTTLPITMTVKEAMEIPPTNEQFLAIIQQQGVPEGIAL
ncbi:MAG: hypothetical protein ABIJ45_08345, partial [Candidatus Zixiibacteriota bacterium]